MPIPEPQTETDFWRKVKTHMVWPAVDEDALRALGDQWKASVDDLLVEVREILSSTAPALQMTWRDMAGDMMARGLRYRADRAHGEMATGIIAVANTCYWGAYYVERLKWNLHRLIDENRQAYADADGAGREGIVTRVVDDASALLDQLRADFDYGRRPTG